MALRRKVVRTPRTRSRISSVGSLVSINKLSARTGERIFEFRFPTDGIIKDMIIYIGDVLVGEGETEISLDSPVDITILLNGEELGERLTLYKGEQEIEDSIEIDRGDKIEAVVATPGVTIKDADVCFSFRGV